MEKENPEDILEYSWNYFKKKVDAEEEVRLKAWKLESQAREQTYED